MAGAEAAYADEDTGKAKWSTKQCCTGRVRDERIDGVVYSMSPSPHFTHSIVVGNIGTTIKNVLDKHKGKCRVFMENLDFHYHPNIDDKKKKGDYITPDVIIVCDPDMLKKDGYYGVPKFVAEVASPSTMNRDKDKKYSIYEEAGVSEYWMVNPKGTTVEIYYLVDGHYKLHNSYMLCDEDTSVGDDKVNVDEVLTLREFPDIKMTLGSIFY